jgi:hypothetical protein
MATDSRSVQGGSGVTDRTPGTAQEPGETPTPEANDPATETAEGAGDPAAPGIDESVRAAGGTGIGFGLVIGILLGLLVIGVAVWFIVVRGV